MKTKEFSAVQYWFESDVAEVVSGCIMQGGAVVAYIMAEGWADAANTK